MESERCEEKTIRGKQRRAVYETLVIPRTGRHILDIVRCAAPSMTYQDLRHILRDFQREGLVVCLNPNCQTGRLYLRSSVRLKFQLSQSDVELCAKILRGKSRLAVLQETARNRLHAPAPTTATQIRKYLRETYPMGLNHVLSALQFLENNGLVEVVDYTRKRDLKIYAVTTKGGDILAFLNIDDRASGDTPTRLSV